jgi:hypothetical protein
MVFRKTPSVEYFRSVTATDCSPWDRIWVYNVVMAALSQWVNHQAEVPPHAGDDMVLLHGRFEKLEAASERKAAAPLFA